MKLSSIFLLLSGLLLTLSSFGQPAFSGLFKETDVPHIYLYEISWEELQAKNKALGAEGYQLIEVDAVSDPVKTRFYAIWQEGGPAARVERAGGWENMVKLKQRMTGEGFVLQNIEGFRDPDGREVFLGIWLPGKNEQKIWRLDNSATVAQQCQTLSREYFQMVDLEAFTNASGGVSFLTLYQKLPPTERAYPVFADNPEDFYREKALRNKSGYALIDYETYDQNGKTYLAGLFKKAPYQENCRHRLDWASFVDYQKFLGSGYQLVDMELSDGPGLVYAPPFRQDRLEDTPNIAHQVVASMVKAAGEVDQSAPAAAANGLTWLARHGFPRLLNAGAKAKAADFDQLARTLAGGNYLQSLRVGGADDRSLIDGLLAYVNERKYEVTELAIEQVNGFDRQTLQTPGAADLIRVEGPVGYPSLAFAQEGLVGSSLVLLEMGIYEPAPGDSLHREFQRIGSRWATLVGYGVNEYGNENPDVLIVHSPSHGGEAPLYLRAKPLENYRSLDTEATLTDPGHPDQESLSAHQQRYMLGALPEEGPRFAIWEGTIVLKLSEPAVARSEGPVVKK